MCKTREFFFEAFNNLMEAHNLFNFDLGFFLADISYFDHATSIFGPLFQDFYEFFLVGFYGCAYILPRNRKKISNFVFVLDIVSEFLKRKRLNIDNLKKKEEKKINVYANKLLLIKNNALSPQWAKNGKKCALSLF